MARMSIDDMIVRDPRITKLAGTVGWSRREVVGCLVMDVWPICYDQRESIIASELIDIAAGRPGFAAAMVESGLASWVRGNRKVRISGAQERIEYLERKREAGRVGGLKSAESRRQSPSTTGSTTQAPGNPPSPSPVPDPSSSPVPDPSHEEKSAPSSDGFLPGLEPSKSKRKRSRREMPDMSPAEAASVRVVLDKLGAQNDVKYTGTPSHARLILEHLRNGVSEMDLRAVIGYCAIERRWKGDPKMHVYLCPETLFGPETIFKYLDPARTWFSKLGGDA